MAYFDILLIACACISILITKKTSNLTNLFNPFIYFFWIYFIFCFVALFYRDIYDYSLIISAKTVTLILLGLILFPAGGFLANHRARAGLTQTSLESLVSNSPRGLKTNSSIIALSIATPIIIATIFISYTGKLLWLTESFDDERVIIRQGIGWISILGITSAYVASIYSSIHFYKQRSPLKIIITTTALALCALSYGNRAPGFEILVIGGIFFWVLVFKKIRPIHIISGFAALITLMMALGLIRQGLDTSLENIYKQILWRPFTNIQNLEWVVSFFPQHHDFLYGQSILIDLSVILPGYQPNFGTYLKELMGKDFTGGSITVSLLGQVYSDFGPLFSVLTLFLTGYIFQKIFLNLATSSNRVPLLIVASITIKSMASSGLISPILYTLLPCILFMQTWNIANTILKRAQA